MSGVWELDSEGNMVAGQLIGYHAYSLGVDSRTGRIYVAALSKGPPYRDGEVSRIFRVYSPGLQLVKEHIWPAGTDWSQLNFAVDPAEPGLFFGSPQNNLLFRVDANGEDLRAWNLPMGTTLLADGRTVVSGLYGLTADPVTGNLFVVSTAGGLLAEFNPRTTAIDFMPGYGAVNFWPDNRRLLVVGGELAVLTRSGP